MELTRRQLIAQGSGLVVAAMLRLVPVAMAGQGPSGQPVPKNVTWRAVLVPDGEPGDPLIISGRIFLPDGKPAEGVVLYVYNTNVEGLYTKVPEPNGPEHPRLAGWVKPDAEGRYEFRTIKPGAYPGRRIPAHIHIRTVGTDYDWIDEFQFTGDPFLTKKDQATSTSLIERYGPAFASIVRVERGADGILRAHRDIRLTRR